MRDDAAGPDGVVEAHPILVVRILAPSKVVLAARVIGMLIDHPVATINSHRVAATEVGLEIGVVTTAIIVTALEVSVLVESDLAHV